jgi:PTS system ascorbate-specific IIC component
MTILNFLINQVFGVAAIFLALIAFLGLLLQKKGLADIMSGTIKTALGVVILQQGTTVLVSSLSPLASAMAALSPATTAVSPQFNICINWGVFSR